MQMTSEPTSDRTAELIAALEGSREPVSEYSPRAVFASHAKELADASLPVPLDLSAEEIAFSLQAYDRQENSAWGLYFGPLMSWRAQDGSAIDNPPLSAITPEVLAHWRMRAGASSHPVLRARYSDLLWEMPKRIDGIRPDPDMARTAADAYLEAVAVRLYEHPTVLVDKVRRALSISLQIGDADRVLRARDALVALEDSIAQDDMLGLWGFSFDALVEPSQTSIPVPDELRDRLIADLEARLLRVSQGVADGYFPSAVEAVAIRLAHHYRRRGLRSDVERVLRVYSDAVQRLTSSGSAILRATALEALYDQLVSFGMRKDASTLDDSIRRAGEESLAEMKPISVSVEIEAEKVEAFFAALLAGEPHAVLTRIAAHFIPRRDELREQMLSQAEQAPLVSMMTRIIKDDDGRTIARVGPVADDVEGGLLQHTGQVLQLSVPWLRESFTRGQDVGACTYSAVAELVSACPLFAPARHPLVLAGLAAYFRSDFVSAIHILVPQIEQCVRQLGISIGAPLYTQRRGAGLHHRTLDDLLRDAAISEVLGTDIATYLRVLLTDDRGWNIRNRVAHGLAPASAFGAGVADRVLHALLTLALFRLRDDGAQPDAPAQEPQSEGEQPGT
jgi:hypothetical protein